MRTKQPYKEMDVLKLAKRLAHAERQGNKSFNIMRESYPSVTHDIVMKAVELAGLDVVTNTNSERQIKIVFKRGC